MSPSELKQTRKCEISVKVWKKVRSTYAFWGLARKLAIFRYAVESRDEKNKPSKHLKCTLKHIQGEKLNTNQ